MTIPDRSRVQTSARLAPGFSYHSRWMALNLTPFLHLFR
jgi:hypothetical protein